MFSFFSFCFVVFFLICFSYLLLEKKWLLELLQSTNPAPENPPTFEIYKRQPETNIVTKDRGQIGDKQGTNRGQTGDNQGTSKGQPGDKQGANRGQTGDKKGTNRGQAKGRSGVQEGTNRGHTEDKQGRNECSKFCNLQIQRPRNPQNSALCKRLPDNECFKVCNL